MSEQRTIRVFISSPADVRPERLKAEQIIARLDREFAYHFHVEAMLWEREPLVASHHFQDPENIPHPRGCDIVVVILWSRLGVMLPADKFRGRVSNRCPVTGTEWEFEDALAASREHGVPDLLLYRKTAAPIAALDDRAAVRQHLDQLDQVEAFVGRWFRAEDGEGYTAASHSFAETSDFEAQLYQHVHALLKRRAGGQTEGIAIRWHAAPYRGLLSFDYEQAPVFFGRTRSRNALRETLMRQIERVNAFVLVFGASGSGKSSLVKAGLLPDLALPGMIGRVGLVRRAAFRPSDAGNDPIAALAAAILAPAALPELLKMHYSAEPLAALLREAPGQAALPIRQGLAEAGRAVGLTDIAEARLAIVVDQLEEIFTIEGFGNAARAAFVAALDTLSKSGLVWVVATMRSDFFDRLETLPPLAALSADGRFLLLPPDDAEIGQIIRQPAQEAGLRFEHDPVTGIALDETVRQVAVLDRAALPLLSFLLDQLWQRRSDDGLLTFAAYRSLKGLEGAIGNRAEEVFQAQSDVAQREFVPLLRELVTIEGGKRVARATRLSDLTEGTPRRTLADALRDPEARLLVSDGGRLRLAHEALLTHWPRAAAQIAADTRDLELRARLEQGAELWGASADRDKKHRVITGLALAEARGLVERWGDELSADLRTFILASRRVARWRRARQWGMVATAPVAVALLVFVVWAGFVWWGVRQVEAEWAANNEFVRIPAGCFQMGSPHTEPGRYPNEEPIHQVCLKAFDLAKFTVTQGEWRAVMVGIAGFPENPNPSYFKGDDRRPVEEVNWNEAQRFIWLMSLLGHDAYRLPTESEWEYAARAGMTTSRFWGENIDDGCIYENIADKALEEAEPDMVPVFASCNDNYGFTTARVGSFKPNPWGLYDMLGNVGNWVEDCYVNNYNDTPTDGGPYKKAACLTRVIHGGSLLGNLRRVRAAYRNDIAPASRYSNLGFRVVRTITP